jgi:delta 1-pyrroline-5-carboxylate dehydrogenase
MLWKGAPATNLCSIATTRILVDALESKGHSGALAALVTGGADVGEAMASDPRMHLLSFTGSTAVGRNVGMTVQQQKLEPQVNDAPLFVVYFFKIIFIMSFSIDYWHDTINFASVTLFIPRLNVIP